MLVTQGVELGKALGDEVGHLLLLPGVPESDSYGIRTHACEAQLISSQSP